jgi:hypothetical protein
MEIRMRTPDGKPSMIGVEPTDKGLRLKVERDGYLADIQLPRFAARAIAEAMLKLLGPIE